MCSFFVDDAFDDILDFVLLQFCNFIDGTALIIVLLDYFDIFKVVDLRNDDVFLEMRHFDL